MKKNSFLNKSEIQKIFLFLLFLPLENLNIKRNVLSPGEILHRSVFKIHFACAGSAER